MTGEVDGLAVARYLRPEQQVVPFRPRPELAELLDWCVTGGHAGVRLVTGDGGAGKTRLALQLVKELTAAGWRPLWVPRGSESSAVREVRVLGQPYVLIVDYAETRGDLAALINAAALDRDGPDLRVLLLARSSGEWWQQLAASVDEPAAALLEASGPLPLGPLPAPGGPQEVFADALAVFARKRGVPRPAVKLGLTDPDPVVLVVHAAALLAVADHAAGDTLQQPTSGTQVLEGLLRHEARYWAQSAVARRLSLDLAVLRLAVAAACLIGAGDEGSASALLGCVPDLNSAERCGQVARWLHDLYPAAHGDQASDREWLGPLRPDRLAEQLITGELSRHPELVPRLFTGLGEARAARALTVLARAALAQDDAVGLLGRALAADLDKLAVPALSVAMETNAVTGELLSRALEEQPVAGEILRRVADACPYPSFAVAAPAAIVLAKLAEATADDHERASWLSDLSVRLADLGGREEALAAIEQAVTIRRQLAQVRPDAFMPDLAAALNNQSNRLAELGRREEALAAIEQAVTIRRQLAQARPDAFMPGLATSLNNQSNHLADLGRREEALAAIEQAAGIYARLAQARPDAFLPGLATSLNNQSNRLAGLGRREEALAAIKQATGIYARLAQGRPDAFLPGLAMSLNNQSNHLADLGRREEALAAIKQATGIYARLAQARPDAFLPDLAAALNNQSLQLAELGRREEALAAIEQAATIRRQLAQARPDAFMPGLATSLNNQSNHLAELGRREEALAAIEQAAGIYARLAQARPDAFLPDLATSLNNQSKRLAGLGRREEALAAIEQAVTIRRRLAQARPDAFMPGLATSLRVLAHVLTALGRESEALDFQAEADAVGK